VFKIPDKLLWKRRNRAIVISFLIVFFGAYVYLSPAVSMRLYHYILFLPWKYPSGYYDDRAIDDLQPKEVWFTSRNGKLLHGWYYALDPKAPCVIIHHGQGANLTVLRPWAKIFKDCGTNVLLYDYQGFGKSEGEPSIEALRNDGVAAFDYVRVQENINPSKIINCGESLGTGVAAHVTDKRNCGGLILISPYASLCECAQQRFPPLHIYPRLLFPNPELECRSVLKRIHPPVLIVHGTADPIINVSNSDELYQNALEPKKYIRIEGGGHCTLNFDHKVVFEGFLRSLPMR
jgi:uncharacterized protein